MIKCNNGWIRMSKMYNPTKNETFTYITASLNNGIIYKEYQIKVGAIKQRYKGKRRLKPLTSHEIQQKIIDSLIKTLGGEIK